MLKIIINAHNSTCSVAKYDDKQKSSQCVRNVFVDDCRYRGGARDCRLASIRGRRGRRPRHEPVLRGLRGVRPADPEPLPVLARYEVHSLSAVPARPRREGTGRGQGRLATGHHGTGVL